MPEGAIPCLPVTPIEVGWNVLPLDEPTITDPLEVFQHVVVLRDWYVDNHCVVVTKPAWLPTDFDLNADIWNTLCVSPDGRHWFHVDRIRDFLRKARLTRADRAASIKIGMAMLTFGISQLFSQTYNTPGDVPVDDGGGVTPPPTDLSTITDAATGAINDITDAIDGELGSAFDSLTGNIGDIVGGITDVLGDVKDTLGGLVSTVSDTFHQLNQSVQDINENLIKPIVGPITGIIEQYRTLHDELTRDLHSGIQGILNIPTDIANAMGSVDATIQRSIATMSTVNE